MAQTMTRTVDNSTLKSGRTTQQNAFDKIPVFKGKLKIDPARALEPARKKLTTLESQRVMAVLDEAIMRTELVTILPYIIEHLEQYSVSFGTDLVAVLQKHEVITTAFDELKKDANLLLEREATIREDLDRQRRNQAFDDAEVESGNDSEENEELAKVIRQVKAAVKSLTAVARQMQHSTKNVFRAFSLNPNALQTVLNDCKQRTHNSQHIIQCLYDLRDHVRTLLLTTPIEEAEKNQYLQEITEREAHNNRVKDKLEAELATALAEKEKLVQGKNDMIKKLQGDLHQIEKYSDEYIRRTKQEADKQQTSDVKNSDGKVTRLQVEHQQLTTQLQTQVQEHRDSEMELRKKKFKIESEVENWIVKYDQDMGVRQEEYEEIDAIYTEEKKQLNELEERFKTLKEEYDHILEERKIARERREAAQRTLAATIRAATTIQAFWRSFKVRKALKTKKKKGGKGKKGQK